MVLQQIAGFDLRDIDGVDRPVPNFAEGIGAPVQSFRIGIAPQFFDHLDEEIAQAVSQAMAVISRLTRGTHEVSLPSLLHANVDAEVATFHENLKGVNGGDYEPLTARAFPASASGARAVDYVRGWRDLQMVRRTVDETLFESQKIDLLIAPTMRRQAPTLEDSLVVPGGGSNERAGASSPAAGGKGNPATRSQTDFAQNTRPFNGYGLPVVSLPCGFSKSGMPIGLQICGPRFAEARVLALAHAYQQATDWHTRTPPLQPDTKVPPLSKAAAEQTGG
jgi:aspartyl-tRNA(Asn)/glutamyl-tRNA(Gln) amidotransferase subunit A